VAADLPMLEGSGDVLQYYADLKHIPLDKVLRNAARDIVFGAYRETPEAPPIKPNPWALVPGRGKYEGKGVHLHIPDYPAIDQARLSAYRIATPRRGYALASFLPVIGTLELKKRPPRKAAPASTLTKAGKFFATASDPYKGAWKKEIETYRAGKTSSHNSPSDYSASRSGGSDTGPWREVRVSEYNLSRYPDWEGKAVAAGQQAAADNIMRDLARLITNPDFHLPS